MNFSILTQSPLPKSIHGINPRTIMGENAWNKLKKQKQIEANHHCMCCGDYVAHIPGDYLECHEVYSVNHEKKQIEFVDIVCLCKKCHDFIHLGRTQMLLKKREISQNYYIEVVKRGMKFLKENKLQRVFLSNYEINNPEWVLVYHGKIYSNRS